MSDDPKVSITSTITVSSQTGGQVIGAYFAARDIQPPDAQDVVAYLKIILNQTNNNEAEEAQLVGRLPFPVRSYDMVDHQRKTLQEAIQEVFEATKKLQQSQRLILLAKPGAGRSQALQKCMEETARQSHQLCEQGLNEHDGKDKDQRFVWPEEAVVPFSVSLADLRAGVPLLALVQAAYNSLAPVEISLDETDKLISRYPCLLLFDDLESLTFPGGLEALRQFMQNYSGKRFIISCLVSAYYGQLGSTQLFILDELTDDEIRSVLGEQGFNALTPQVRQLARNRAMLKRILSMQQGLSIPQNKGLLVQDITRATLGFPQPLQDQSSLDLEMAEGLLERLAYTMLVDGTQTYSESQIRELFASYLQEWYEPSNWRMVGRALRRIGILQRTSDRRWGFRDVITHAYFAASAVWHNPTLLEEFINHAMDIRLHEPFEILAGLQTNPWDLVFQLIDKNAILAAHCISATGRSVDPALGNTLVDALIDKMNSASGREHDEVVQLLSQSGSPRVKETFLRMLYEEKDSRLILTIANALWFIAQTQPSKSLQELDQELKKIRPTRTVEVVVDLWRAYSEGDPTTQEALQQRLISCLKRNDRDRLLRVSSASAIALGSLGTDLARQTLLEVWLQPDVDEFLVACIVEGLTQMKHPDVENLALSVYSDPRYRRKRSQHLRAQSIYLLGWVGSQPEHVKILYQALEDPAIEVRQNAAFSIGHLELNDARQRLEDRLRGRKEKESVVICKIIEALGKVGTPETVDLLNSFLRDEALAIRRSAREAKAEIDARYTTY